MKNLFCFVMLVLGTCIMVSCSNGSSNGLSFDKSEGNYEVNGAVFKGIYSNGEKFEIRFDDFRFSDLDYHYGDTIYANEDLVSGDSGFEDVKYLGKISERQEGCFTVRLGLYECAYDVYVISNVHQPELRRLKFFFEAEEIWYGDILIAKQPYSFAKEGTDVINIDVSDNIKSRFLLKFAISAYIPYENKTAGKIVYVYDVSKTREQTLPN